jgi:hypothetical protein
MPTKQNNSGFGYLPVLIISALVISGTYFGYSWYSNNSSQEVENKISAVAEEDMSDKDVLQFSTTKPKIPANYNPNKLPVVWSIIDDSTAGVWQMYFFLTGTDIKKLEEAVDKVKNSKFKSLRQASKPCIPSGNSVIYDEYDQNVTKLAEDFYLVTVKNVNTYWKSDIDKVCQIATGKLITYRGLKFDEFVFAPKGVSPMPASILFSSTPTTGTGPKAGLSKSAGQSKANEVTPTVKLPVDVTKMKQTQY